MKNIEQKIHIYGKIYLNSLMENTATDYKYKDITKFIKSGTKMDNKVSVK